MIFANADEKDIQIIREFKKNETIYIEVKAVNKGCRCLKCGTYHTNVKEYKTKYINHSIYTLENTVLIYHQRRYICPKCNKTHMEDNPFCSENNRISDKTVESILTFLKRYNNPFRAAANYFHLSTTEIIKIFDKYCQMERNKFTRVMCFDEIYFSRKRRKKYVLVIINFFNRAIIDVLKDRDKSTLSSYLRKIDVEERNRVSYVCIDMNDNYRDLLNVYFHNAFIVVDSFHVVKHIVEALDDVRKKVMRRFESNKKSDEYYLLKYKDELLYIEDSLSNEYKEPKYRHHFHYLYSDYEMLNMMLNLDSNLKNAYELYHAYIRFNNTDYDNPVDSLNDLNEIVNDFKLSNIEEFIKLSDMLNNWKAEIVNSFAKVNGTRVSNGPIEGRNSLIKKILKIANGYTNFKRFRNRVIYCLNTLAKHNFKSQ